MKSDAESPNTNHNPRRGKPDFGRRHGSNSSTRQNPLGFTLIELFVAISIVLILIAIGSQGYIRSSQIARNNKRQGDLKNIQLALQQFFAVNHTYPVTTGRAGCWVDFCGESSAYGSYVNNYIPGLAPTYIGVLPHDPRASTANTALNAICTTALTGYVYRSDGKDYKLQAHCTVEGGVITSTSPWYDPRPRDYVYSLFTPGARDW